MALAVLDASAIIALLRNEPGSAVIASYIGEALISAVNLQEVIKALLVRGIPVDAIHDMLDALHLDIRPHGKEEAYAAAALHKATMIHGSGLGDRTAMALAIAETCPIVTTDQAWAKISIPGLQVILAR